MDTAQTNESDSLSADQGTLMALELHYRGELARALHVGHDPLPSLPDLLRYAEAVTACCIQHYGQPAPPWPDAGPELCWQVSRAGTVCTVPLDGHQRPDGGYTMHQDRHGRLW